VIPVERYAAVVFDLFGTLVPAYRHAVVLSEMAAILRLDPSEFIRAFAEETREARETGAISLAENLRGICKTLGDPVSSADVARAVAVRRDFTVRALTPRQGAVDALVRLRAHGLGVGLISDCCEVVSDAWESSPLASHVDAAVLSCRVGLRKPDARIYERACHALQVPASACLYVGDGGSHELTGALAFGMEAALLHVPEETSDDPYRPDAAAWAGPVIHSLGELLTT
jgi:putative hydrolase of the HAD superfamily